MRLVFAGTPDVAVPSLQALVDSSHDVVGVITRPPAPRGRGRTLEQSDVHRAADERGLPVLTPARPADADCVAQLEAWQPDVVAVVAYGALVPREVLDLASIGWINLHFSLLPAWRGAAPVQRAILAGDEVTGASTFLLDEGLDTGPVFGMLTETVRPRDTSGELLNRLSHSGSGLLTATIDAIASGAARPDPQSSDGVSLAPKLNPADAQIPWGLPALHIDRLVRACTPAPGAWTTAGGERLRVLPVLPSPDVTDLEPGSLRIDKSGVYVGTGSHAVRLGEVAPAGKRVMAATDWARGLRGQLPILGAPA